MDLFETILPLILLYFKVFDKNLRKYHPAFLYFVNWWVHSIQHPFLSILAYQNFCTYCLFPEDLFLELPSVIQIDSKHHWIFLANDNKPFLEIMKY